MALTAKIMTQTAEIMPSLLKMRCADAIFGHLETADRDQTCRDDLECHPTSKSSLWSGFWNIRRFFTSWLLNFRIQTSWLLNFSSIWENLGPVMLGIRSKRVDGKFSIRFDQSVDLTQFGATKNTIQAVFRQVRRFHNSPFRSNDKFSSQEVKNRRTFQNPDLKLDIGVW